MPHLHLDEDLLPQLARQLGGTLTGGTLSLAAEVGEGTVRRRGFPGGLDLVTLDFTLSAPTTFTAHTAADSPHVILNFNLSGRPIDKRANALAARLDDGAAPSVLAYGADVEIVNPVPASMPFRLVQVRIHDSLFAAYPGGALQYLRRPVGDVAVIAYDFPTVGILREAVDAGTSDMSAHALVLECLGRLAPRFAARGTARPRYRIHPADLAALLVVAAGLREEVRRPAPGVAELARQAGASPTKFKAQFRQLLGASPAAYHRLHSLGYARRALRGGGSSVSELSEELGYAGAAQFSRAYRRQFGHPPSRDAAGGD